MRGVGFTADGVDAVEAGSDEPGFAFVACPSSSLAWRLDLRECNSRALLRAADGSLWLLGMQGLAWTRAHLAAASSRIGNRSEASGAGIAADLARDFSVPSVSLTAPRTLCAQELWNIRQIGAMLLHDRSTTESADETHGGSAVERRLQAKLDAAVTALVETLDAESLMLATPREFDGRIYNWLLRGQGQHRRQFARGFPLLLPYAVSGHRQAAELHRIVDRGQRLADGLAGLWSVRPAVIRALQQPASAAAPMWLRDPKSLASTWHALPRETWPRDPAAWRRFDRLVGRAIRTLTPVPWESTVALAWLRDGLTGRHREGDARTAGEGLRDGVVRVQQMRDALIELLVGSLRPRSPKALATQRSARVVDGFLLKLSPAHQVTLADRYRDELLRSLGSDVLADRIGLLHGARGWPLLPGDYVSADGRRRVVPVCSRQELRRCGEVFENCLRSSHFNGYARNLIEGTAFYAALLEASTAEPCSLVEIAVDDPVEAPIKLSVAQHQTAGNAGMPSPECRAAVADVLRLANAAPLQAHLRRGLQAMRARAASTRTGSRLIGRSALAATLWKVIGTPGMAAIVQRLRAATHGEPGAADDFGGRAGQLALPL